MVTVIWTAANTLWGIITATEKHMQLLIVNCSRSLTMWTIEYMKLSSTKHRLNTNNQSLPASLFFNRQNFERWTFTTTIRPNILTETSSKCRKWIQIHSTLLLQRKNWKIVSHQKWKLSKNYCNKMRTTIVSMLTKSETFFPNVKCQTQETWQARIWVFWRGVQKHRDVLCL